MATQQAQANSKDFEGQPVMEFPDGMIKGVEQSAKHDCTHNKSIKTYDIPQQDKQQGAQRLKWCLRKFTIPQPPAGLRNNAIQIPIIPAT